MTNEEIKRELDKIPKKDKEKVADVKKLNDEELANLAGGMTSKTKKILKGLAIAGAFGTALGATATVAYKLGRSSGLNKNNDKHQKELEELNSRHQEELEETGMRAALTGKVAGNVQGYQRGYGDAIKNMANEFSDKDQVQIWATVFSTMMTLNKRNPKF